MNVYNKELYFANKVLQLSKDYHQNVNISDLNYMDDILVLSEGQVNKTIYNLQLK